MDANQIWQMRGKDQLDQNWENTSWQVKSVQLRITGLTVQAIKVFVVFNMICLSDLFCCEHVFCWSHVGRFIYCYTFSTWFLVCFVVNMFLLVPYFVFSAFNYQRREPLSNVFLTVLLGFYGNVLLSECVWGIVVCCQQLTCALYVAACYCT